MELTEKQRRILRKMEMEDAPVDKVPHHDHGDKCVLRRLVREEEEKNETA